MSSPDTKKERPNINFHKYYDCIFVVVKKEIFRVFLWLYEGGSQYVGDYLKTTPRGMKRLRAMEKEALEKKEPPATFDITFLYFLLQHTCGLAKDTAAIWNNPTTTEERKSLEHTLYLLKGKRNRLSHDPQPLMHMTKEDLDREIIDLKQLCSLIIHEAGQKAIKPSDEVDRCVNNMEVAFDEIITNPTPSGYTPGKFALLAKQEMKDKHNMHSSASTKTFVMPLIHMKGKTGLHEAPLKLFPLWRCEDGSLPTATVLQGETGTGKTSICQYIFDSWVSCNDEINDLQDFDLVVPVQCCKVSTRDLVEFLKEFLADTISSCGREDATEFLRSLRILWLVDGFEEATVDARELLKKIEERGTSSSHLIFITTKPQNRQDLIDSLTSKDKLCDVNLLGLSDEGIELLIEKVLEENEKDSKICEENKIKFLKETEALGDEILMELKIPLKLTLILKLWQEGKLSKESGASLFLLYKEIMEVQEKKLIETLKAKSYVNKDKIPKRVEKWIQLLWKIAFDMFMNNIFVNIDKISQTTLEEDCENFLVSTDNWLAKFLQFQSKDEGNNLSFIHNSHQLHLAARHVCLLMKQESNPAEFLETLFEQMISLEEINRKHMYTMLLHVVSNVALQQTTDQPAAKVLIKLLSMCNDFDAFEVVQCAAYSQVLVKEVSKFTPQEWTVVDHTVKAAMALLEFKTPSVIVLDIDGEPKDLKELINFITKISRRDLKLQIDLRFHYTTSESNESSDCYLEPICSSDAKCSLVDFSGNLTVDGCQYLTKMSKVRKLCLRVSSNKVLDQILCNLKYMRHLDSITLALVMPVVKAPISSYEYSVKEFIINLLFIDKIHIEEIASALSQINQHYKIIYLYDISASDAIKFIQKLEEKNIKVDLILRILKGHSYGLDGGFAINYGPVPLISPESEFYDKWNNTYLFKSENEMGVKEVRLMTEGIPSSDVTYFECIGESKVKEILLS